MDQTFGHRSSSKICGSYETAELEKFVIQAVKDDDDKRSGNSGSKDSHFNRQAFLRFLETNRVANENKEASQ